MHKIIHLLGMHKGIVIAETRNENETWVGFQCEKCKKIEDMHRVDEIIDRELRKEYL